MEITANYPIVRNGFELEDGLKYAKFKHRGDFTFTIKGKLEELDSIEFPLKSIIEKCVSQQIHC